VSDLGDIYTRLAFWKQIQGDARRTVLCEPHRVDEVRALVEERGYDHITVRASPVCPEGQFLVIDEVALEASWQQSLQRMRRAPFFP